VETRAIKWARASKLRKYDQLRSTLTQLAGALGVDVELCLQEVGNVTRERFRGHELAQEAWATGLRDPRRQAQGQQARETKRGGVGCSVIFLCT